MNIVIQLLASFAASFFFSLLFNQPRKTIPVSASIALIGYGIFMFLNQTTVGFFFSTLFMAIACEIAARLMKKATPIFLVTAIIPIIPGVGLYRTVRYIVEGNYSMAAHTGTDALLGILAVALAITFSSLLFANIPHHTTTKGNNAQ